MAMTAGERGVNSATARAPVEAEYSINDAPASVSGTSLLRPLSPPSHCLLVEIGMNGALLRDSITATLVFSSSLSACALISGLTVIDMNSCLQRLNASSQPVNI